MKIEKNKCVLYLSSPTNAMPAMKKTAEWIRIGKLFSDLEKEIGSPVDFELPESFNKSKRLTGALCEPSKLLKEELLVLADLSPAATIKPTRSLVVQEKITESPRVLRSSSKGNVYCRKRARAEKCSNNDDDEVVRTVEWVHNAERIVGDMHEVDGGRDGDFMFKLIRKDALEKFKYTLCDADQLALAGVPLVELQHAVAHHSLESNAINHQLLLRVAHSENELQTYKSKASEMNQKVEEKTRTGSLQKLEELEKSLNDSYSKNIELKMRLDQSNSQLKKAREESVKAFTKSNTYTTLVTKRAALHEYQGFSKCLQQAMKLAAFRKDFDMSLLDPFKNEKSGKDPIIVKDEVDAESEEDEFAFVLKHLDQGD